MPKIDSARKGDAVRKLQDFLLRLKYPIGTIDGIFGKSTLDALKSLQRDAKLPDTGLFGAQTRRALVDRLAALAGIANERPSTDRLIQVYTTLGNVMRGREKFDEAANAYSEALKLQPTISKEHWNLFYSRAVCYERLKRWPLAGGRLPEVART